MKRIAFTGGGSIGHVAVNVALIPYFQQKGYETFYIGSKNGIEKEMISELDNVPYYAISSGKLRRYFDLKNFSDPFKVMKGIADAVHILKREKPDFVFSKGGFVSVPVAIAAKLLKIPIVLHESDVTPGLANKISIRFANHIFTTFEQTAEHLPANQATPIGAIIRDNLFSGDKDKGLQWSGFSTEKPILLVMGGSLGSKAINDAIRSNLDELLLKYQIIHLTGKGLLDTHYQRAGYQQYEFITNELNDILAMTDFVVSRAGSNSIFEFLALKIPMLLIPLSNQASRGDQILNAAYFEKQGYALVLNEEDVTSQTLMEQLSNLEQQAPTIKETMATYKMQTSLEDFYQLILQHTNN
ncbi:MULTISPECIES: undecaprenyldiphospho-muramoylpentapeptide beta-N-acetylglucosaminyltransferase [unclassified Facklamia]|uniref:undecaprenyldiphospho-muramoylpentapeptide beta-N-acetylglucosaminyltransferase n=1 Tax=Aerococcaceae TaxID=186827 RepID=UPI0013BB2C8E|nr:MULTISPECIES: undecaprenyldiphospho-muramoylpentapeptide beta-N-acetylglucosaminyltransferase [unclassified Facklamia]NEW64294.1 undecaprenyldiphospho-muramoylpentapeptide beta-N-acetylglucosaminyltransferase [Facklamia sp. 252]NEW67869.1 undecaprenyldiphospho-muramoylpentapeptide beta-N-acetylglucosaminyltransferase [Facklamia sp. 253]QQD64759.1 undecaprenyldiphospho-muramoylpentapeptide beta-N-acetylglucosaminyltransferase [Aerococcaceae bacterium zg-252]